MKSYIARNNLYRVEWVGDNNTYDIYRITGKDGRIAYGLKPLSSNTSPHDMLSMLPNELDNDCIDAAKNCNKLGCLTFGPGRWSLVTKIPY